MPLIDHQSNHIQLKEIWCNNLHEKSVVKRNAHLLHQRKDLRDDQIWAKRYLKAMRDTLQKIGTIWIGYFSKKYDRENARLEFIQNVDIIYHSRCADFEMHGAARVGMSDQQRADYVTDICTMYRVLNTKYRILTEEEERKAAEEAEANEINRIATELAQKLVGVLQSTPNGLGAGPVPPVPVEEVEVPQAQKDEHDEPHVVAQPVEEVAGEDEFVQLQEDVAEMAIVPERNERLIERPLFRAIDFAYREQVIYTGPAPMDIDAGDTTVPMNIDS